MSAMEQMVRTVLKAMNLDVGAIQKEVTSRIELFEGNVNTLNGTLIDLHKVQQEIRANLKLLMEAQGLQYLTASEKEKSNGSQPRGNLPAIT